MWLHCACVCVCLFGEQGSLCVRPSGGPTNTATQVETVSPLFSTSPYSYCCCCCCSFLPINETKSDDIITHTNAQSFTLSNFTWRGNVLIISLQPVFPQGVEILTSFATIVSQTINSLSSYFYGVPSFLFPRDLLCTFTMARGHNEYLLMSRMKDLPVCTLLMQMKPGNCLATLMKLTPMSQALIDSAE